MRAHYRLRLAVVLGTAILLAALAIGTRMVVDRSQSAAWQQAEETLERSGRVAETIVNNHFLQVDSALTSLPEILASAGHGNPLTGPTVRRLMQGLAFQTFSSRDIHLVRPNGEVFLSARSVRVRPFTSLAETLASGLSPGSSTLLGPTKNPRTGDWVVYLARPVVLGELGAFIALAEMPIASLTAALAPIGEAAGLTVTLLGDGDVVLGAMPHDELAVGKPSAQIWIRGAATNVLTRVQAKDGAIEALGAVRSTLYGNVQIVLEISAKDALAGWNADRRKVYSGAFSGVVLLLLFAVVVLLGLTQRDRLERDRKLAQQALEDAIRTMSDGFAMWDAKGRLVVANERFHGFGVAGPVLDTGHGADADNRHRLGSSEEHLPDGRWVLVTRSRMSDGGVVGVYKDITDRRNQEDVILRYSEELGRLAVRFETTVKSARRRWRPRRAMRAARSRWSHRRPPMRWRRPASSARRRKPHPAGCGPWPQAWPSSWPLSRRFQGAWRALQASTPASPSAAEPRPR